MFHLEFSLSLRQKVVELIVKAILVLQVVVLPQICGMSVGLRGVQRDREMED